MDPSKLSVKTAQNFCVSARGRSTEFKLASASVIFESTPAVGAAEFEEVDSFLSLPLVLPPNGVFP